MIGIDIGDNNCKLAVHSHGGIHIVSRRMPENMVRDGELVSPETMAKFLESLHKEEGIREKDCALVLRSSQVFFRHVTMPPMTISELKLNLPYEFRDFITKEANEYIYDYAVDELIKDEADTVTRMELYAAAVSKDVVKAYAELLQKAGFRLKTVIPAPMAYARLLHHRVNAAEVPDDRDFVMVDIGYSGIVVSLFHGLRYDSARTIDFGCFELDSIIGDLKGVDPFTASSYKYSNFEGVLDDPDCLALCDRMAMEVSKVINFYNFSNRDREIECLYYMGGGASIPQVLRAMDDMITVPTQSVLELMPAGLQGELDASAGALALAALYEAEAM